MKQVVVSAIPVHMLPLIWPVAQPLVEMATEFSNNELDSDIVYDRLINEEMILLVVNKLDKIIAAITIEKRTFDTGKSILTLSTAGGEDMDVWIDQIDAIVDSLAEEHGCKQIYIIGRKGWSRKLKDRGYKVAHTTLCKNIGEQ